MKTSILNTIERNNWLSKTRRCVVGPYSLMAMLLIAGSGWLLAQGKAGSSHHPTFDLKRPPPVNLSEACSLAMAHIGEATNRIYCVTASCLDRDSQRSAGWTFEFSNTNGDHAVVKVFFSKEVWIDPKSSAVLR